MRITVQVLPTLCLTCLANVGITDVFINPTNPPTATFDDSESATVAEWDTNPPPPHNHAVNVDPALTAAWDAWGAKNVRLAGLPAPPLNGPDPFALLRARWTAELQAARTVADGLGVPT